MERQHADSVLVLELEDLASDPRSLLSHLERLKVAAPKAERFTGLYDEVPQSPKLREKAISKADIEGFPSNRSVEQSGQSAETP